MPGACRVAPDDLHAFCREALTRAGVRADPARISADALATTDSWGSSPTGRSCSPATSVGSGAAASGATPTRRSVAEGPAWAIVDGNSALGQVVGIFAMDEAIARAWRSGIACIAVWNSNHFGAAGYYATLAARSGLFALAMANDAPGVVSPSPRAPVTGTDPLAYAIPAGDRDPISLDIAISMAAGGKVYAARQVGRSPPTGSSTGRDRRRPTPA